MRVRTRSACVVLAWSILLILVAVGSKGFARSDQANIRIASSTTSSSITSNPSQVTLTRVTMTSNAASQSGAATSAAARPAPRRGTRTTTESQPATGSPAEASTRAEAGTYVVQPGDTLSGIAAALGIRGGWPALYAANRQAIGPDPDVIRAGTALALAGRAASARYTVGAGDTLTGIAAALGIRRGWTALYAANRQIIGPDPDVIRAGTVLTIPPPAPSVPASAAPHPGSRPSPPPATTPAPARTPASAQPSASAAAPPTAPASARPSAPSKAPVPATGGLPRWLEIVLLAAGVLIGTAFLTEPVLAITRRRRPAVRPAARPAAGGPAACAAPPEPRILLADYDRLVVTCSGPDGTVCVLRPPGADPEVILLAARLVLAQDRYEELAGHLGVAAHGRRE